MTDDFDALPTRIRAKIKLGNRPDDCWTWTGLFQPPHLAERVLPPLSEGTAKPRGRRRSTDVVIVRKRGIPKVHSSSKGYTVPAHREIYSLVKGIPFDDLPKLARCHNSDRCVNPHHCHQTAHVAVKVGRKLHQGPRKGQKSDQEYVLAMLKKNRPATFMSDMKLVGEECHCDPPRPETWKAYLEWDAQNPEED